MLRILAGRICFWFWREKYAADFGGKICFWFWREKYASDFGRTNMLLIFAEKICFWFRRENLILILAGKFDPNFDGKIGRTGLCYWFWREKARWRQGLLSPPPPPDWVRERFIRILQIVYSWGKGHKERLGGEYWKEIRCIGFSWPNISWFHFFFSQLSDTDFSALARHRLKNTNIKICKVKVNASNEDFPYCIFFVNFATKSICFYAK